jgi:hypothetical protein
MNQARFAWQILLQCKAILSIASPARGHRNDRRGARGVELRQLSLSGGFGLLSNNQSMSIGGRSVLISYSWRY